MKEELWSVHNCYIVCVLDERRVSQQEAPAKTNDGYGEGL